MNDGLGSLLFPPRLDALKKILDAEDSDNEFDRLARLVSQALRVPTSLITLVGATDQHFRGICGGSEAMEEGRGGPHEHSLCRFNVVKGSPVIIGNASADPEFRENPIVVTNGIEAYLSVPLVDAEGLILGTICGIDYSPREWTSDEMDMLRDYAAIAMVRIDALAMNERLRLAFDVALHDLKTPLCVPTMASGIFQDRMHSVPVDLRPLVKVVESSTAAAVKLVETLGSTKRDLLKGNCGDASGLCEAVIKRISPSAERKGAEIRLEIRESAVINAARWMVEQILENLVSNAVKYGPRNGVVTLTCDVADGNVVIVVEDQGPGFSASDIPLMFRRYVRLSASPTDGEPSTGLGLSIVKRLVQQCDGTIALLSAPSESTRFKISLPASR